MWRKYRFPYRSPYPAGIPVHSETAVLLTAVLSVFKIYLLALVCFVSLYLTIIKRYRAAFDFVFDGVVGTPQLLGDT